MCTLQSSCDIPPWQWHVVVLFFFGVGHACGVVQYVRSNTRAYPGLKRSQSYSLR